MRFTKWAVGTFVMLAGLLCLATPRSATSQGNGTQHFEGAFSVTFFDDCSGEFVDIDVTYKSDVHVVATKSGTFHLDFHDVYSGRGVGETTGTEYLANQTDSFSLNLAKGANETEPLHFSMISKGGADNLEFAAIFHITIDANGVVTSFVDNANVVCRGK